MKIEELVAQIKTLPDCTVLPPSGLPILNDQYSLPDELSRFYEICGGINLFENAPYSVTILPPTEFRPANNVFWDEEVIQAAKDSFEVKVSSDWYVVVDLQDSNYIVVDLNKDRHGKCYKAFWDSYAVVGETPIVAGSFSELLERLILNRGEYWYFLEDNFKSYGDAYDEV